VSAVSRTPIGIGLNCGWHLDWPVDWEAKQGPLIARIIDTVDALLRTLLRSAELFSKCRARLLVSSAWLAISVGLAVVMFSVAFIAKQFVAV
jgi:hypothetical protein